MTTESIIEWLRDRAKGADWEMRRVMRAAADRLEMYHKNEKHGRWVQEPAKRWVECSECHTVGSPRWKCCPVCEAKMDAPHITDQTLSALYAMGQKTHKEE